MRKGLTLIELILSMVIIGIVFTVIPRLIMSMNQAAQTTVKEEAMYNAVALMGAIINLPWDNNNTQNSQILNVTDGYSNYDCNATTGYRRIGGFVGGRNCRALNDGTYNFNASIDFNDNDGLFNDIDDYNNSTIDTNGSCTSGSKNLYKIATTVAYLPEKSIPLNGTTNTKTIQVKVGYNDGKHTGCITDLNYTSYNIGNIQINSRTW